MKFNTLAQAALGTTTISVDGVVPAGLIGVLAGNPQWKTSTDLIFGYRVSTGPDVFGIGTLAYPAGPVVNQDSIGQNDLCAGGGNDAAYLAGGANVGVRTNFGIGPFSAAALGDMDEFGRYVMVTSQATARGLQAFDAAGVAKWSNAALLGSINVKARTNIVAYEDEAGWHLTNITTGVAVALSQRADDVLLMIPVVVGSSTIVVEFTAELGMSVRGATSDSGYVIPDTTENFFNPDAAFVSGMTVRVGGSVNSGEVPTDLRAFDINVTNGTFRSGVTTSGALVWTNQTALTRTQFTVGATTGAAAALAMLAGLYQQAVVVRDTLRMTQPWYTGLMRLFKELVAPIDLSSNRVTGILQQGQGGTGNSTGTVNLPQSFLTSDDDSATLINSRQLLAGDGIALDTTVANELTISATGGAGVPYYVPVATTFTIPVNIQGLWTMPITVDGTLVVDGYLVEVT